MKMGVIKLPKDAAGAPLSEYKGTYTENNMEVYREETK